MAVVVILTTLCISWSDDEIPPLYLACHDVPSVSRVSITLLLMDKDVNQDDRMGQAVLGLSHAAKTHAAVPFDLTVTHNGRACGSIRGKVQIVWPGGVGRGTSMISPDQTKSSKCCVIC